MKGMRNIVLVFSLAGFLGLAGGFFAALHLHQIHVECTEHEHPHPEKHDSSSCSLCQIFFGPQGKYRTVIPDFVLVTILEDTCEDLACESQTYLQSTFLIQPSLRGPPFWFVAEPVSMLMTSQRRTIQYGYDVFEVVS